jgi:hypothetical protein
MPAPATRGSYELSESLNRHCTAIFRRCALVSSALPRIEGLPCLSDQMSSFLHADSDRHHGAQLDVDSNV